MSMVFFVGKWLYSVCFVILVCVVICFIVMVL